MRPYILHIHERPITLVKFVNDGDFFVSCAKDGEICLIRTEDCVRIGTYTPPGGSGGACYAVDVTLGCEYVVTAGADGKLQFFHFSGEHIKAVNHGGILKYCEWNHKPGAQNLVVTCNDKFKTAAEGLTKNRIMIWEFDEERGCQRKLSIEDALPMKCTKVKWGAFDETLVSIFEEGTCVIWCSKTGEQLNLVQAHHSAVTSMNFSRDGMLMITCSKDQTAKLWAMDKMEVVKTYKTDRPLNDAAISPLFDHKDDPKYHILLGGGQDAKDVTTTAGSSGKFEAILWHMVYEEEIGSVKGGFGPLNTLAWFPDGQGFVTGGEDGYVRVHSFDPEYKTSKKYD